VLCFLVIRKTWLLWLASVSLRMHASRQTLWTVFTHKVGQSSSHCLRVGLASVSVVLQSQNISNFSIYFWPTNLIQTETSWLHPRISFSLILFSWMALIFFIFSRNRTSQTSDFKSDVSPICPIANRKCAPGTLKVFISFWKSTPEWSFPV